MWYLLQNDVRRGPFFRFVCNIGLRTYNICMCATCHVCHADLLSLRLVILHLVRLGWRSSTPSAIRFWKWRNIHDARSREKRPCSLRLHRSQITNFIDEALEKGDSVLMHSFRGTGRCIACASAYLMFRHRWGFEKALDFLCSKRSDAAPNAGIVQQVRWSNIKTGHQR